MTIHLDDPRQIQEKMSELRDQISTESKSVGERTRRALDWKYQVAAHPVASAVIATAVGFWLVPRKRAPMIENSMEEMRALVEQQTTKTRPSAGLGQTLAMAAGSMLVRSVASGVWNRVVSAWCPSVAGHADADGNGNSALEPRGGHGQ